ncbi:hypothetical protein [Oricola nitratireducens]|uniref:hypothetical protein n=1 Tax=Oricola nitratireducens TaxID=2775868 RepID=UPI0018669024|nr:hypothetical protein [Oricola nitratireducens]
MEPTSRNRLDLVVIAVFSICAVVAAAALAGDPAVPFANFFGPIPPVTATLIVVAVAAVAHIALRALDAFHPLRAGTLHRGFVVAALAAPVLAVPTVIADLTWKFPPGINVAPPQAFLFYPLMGYVAETAFHLVPLSLVLLAARLVTGARPSGRIVWVAIGVAALVEPVFQASGIFGTGSVVALEIFMLAHLTLFSIVLLVLYRRYGFVTAFAFRIVYYLVWHILWGTARLQILF